MFVFVFFSVYCHTHTRTHETCIGEKENVELCLDMIEMASRHHHLSSASTHPHTNNRLCNSIPTHGTSFPHSSKSMNVKLWVRVWISFQIERATSSTDHPKDCLYPGKHAFSIFSLCLVVWLQKKSSSLSDVRVYLPACLSCYRFRDPIHGSAVCIFFECVHFVFYLSMCSLLVSAVTARSARLCTFQPWMVG